MARDRIVGADPADLNLILGLWHLRLSCLARLRLFNQTTAECTNLFTVLNNVQPPEARLYVFERLLPFELEVMQTRLKYWAGDHMGYLDSLAALLRKCKVSARAGASTKDSTTSAMWKERGARVVLIMASQMVEMKVRSVYLHGLLILMGTQEFTAASRLLEPLCTNAALRSAIARIYLQSGNLAAASEHFRLVAEDDAADERQKLMNNAVLLSAEGDWAKATEVLKSLMEKDSEDFVAVNNMAVALLNQGKLKEAIEVLENALSSSPSAVVVAEPFLFNLCVLLLIYTSEWALTNVPSSSDIIRTAVQHWVCEEAGAARRGGEVERRWAEDNLLEASSQLAAFSCQSFIGVLSSVRDFLQSISGVHSRLSYCKGRLVVLSSESRLPWDCVPAGEECPPSGNVVRKAGSRVHFVDSSMIRGIRGSPLTMQNWAYRFLISLAHVISFKGGAFNEAPKMPKTRATRVSMMIWGTYDRRAFTAMGQRDCLPP